ncbi:hypothetical protein GCM10023196_021330 [Actinoallomurus vinaceus]|uniref:STAS domain-containing protein n=1 Tax=Actinoallomurus vinaceus TaxID=1080074 RepID=A0ABP8U873_9ACTN
MAERNAHAAEAVSPEATLVLYEDDQLSIVQATPPDTVLLKGDIDITNSAALADALAQVTARWGQVSVDTAELRFIDVSGWRVLLASPARPRPRLLNVAPCVRRLSDRMMSL